MTTTAIWVFITVWCILGGYAAHEGGKIIERDGKLPGNWTPLHKLAMIILSGPAVWLIVAVALSLGVFEDDDG